MAREYYATPPTDEELASIGLRRSDIDAVELWPDNVPAYLLFDAMATQWRMGQNGPYGFDYASLPSVWPLVGIEESKRPEVFADLRVMEIEALKVMRE